MSHVPLLQDLYAKFADGDVPAVLAMFDADLEWRQAESNPYRPSGEPWHGPQAVLDNLLVKLGSEWQDFTVTPQRFHGAEGVVIVEGRYTGTFTATGEPLDAQFCHVWAVRDGKVVRFQQYLDTAQLRRVMGR